MIECTRSVVVKRVGAFLLVAGSIPPISEFFLPCLFSQNFYAGHRFRPFLTILSLQKFFFKSSKVTGKKRVKRPQARKFLVKGEKFSRIMLGNQSYLQLKN